MISYQVFYRIFSSYRVKRCDKVKKWKIFQPKWVFAFNLANFFGISKIFLGLWGRFERSPFGALIGTKSETAAAKIWFAENFGGRGKSLSGSAIFARLEPKRADPKSSAECRPRFEHADGNPWNRWRRRSADDGGGDRGFRQKKFDLNLMKKFHKISSFFQIFLGSGGGWLWAGLAFFKTLPKNASLILKASNFDQKGYILSKNAKKSPTAKI